MRDISSVERKRKQHQPSTAGDLSASTTVEDDSSRDPLKRNITSSSASKFESEDIVTSSKRIKPSKLESKPCQRGTDFDPTTNSGLAVVIEQQDHTRRSTAYGTRETKDNNDESREHKTVSEKRNSSTGADYHRFLARYRKGPPNNFPDYGPPDVPDAVELAPGRSRMMMGERKSAGLSGGFRPQNTLQRGGSENQSLPRPTRKKAFDLHDNASLSTLEDYRATKRQKLGPDKLVRRTSSSSIIDLSGEGSRSGTVQTVSSKGSSSKKTVQSGGARSRKQTQMTELVPVTVDAFIKVEEMVGFKDGMTIKALQSELSKQEQPHGTNETDVSQQSKQREMVSRPFDFTGRHSHDVKGREHILIRDGADDIEEVSPGPPKYKGTANLSAPRPKIAQSSRRLRKLSPRELVTSGKSRHFEPLGKPNAEDVDAPQAYIYDDSTNHATRLTLRVGEKDSMDGERNTNEVDINEDLDEDSVDLLSPEISKRNDQFETIELRSRTKPFRSLGAPKSESIATEGDIPHSTLSRVHSKTAGVQKRPASKPDIKFNLVYLGAGLTEISVQDHSDQWQLQFDHEKRNFDLFDTGKLVSDDYRSLILKPDKIHNITFHDESAKLVILRASEANLSSHAQLRLQTQSPSEASRFVNYIREISNNVQFKRIERSDRLDKIFEKATESKSKFAYQIPRRKPEDIALIEVKEARIATAKEKMRQAERKSRNTTAETGPRSSNIGRRRSSTLEDETIVHQTRGRSSAALEGISWSDPASKNTMVHNTRLSSSQRTSTNYPETVYQSHPATRSSFVGRSGDKNFVLPKTRSLSPPSWTRENSGWMEDRGWKKSLVFPSEGKKKSTVDALDVERLDEGKFLNDNIIEFYLRYLEDRLEKSHPILARRIYFQNTFFYETLTKGKVRSNNINYDAVKRWTTKVDLFSYDYVIVPVCEKLHWYVAIICNLPKLLREHILEKNAGKTEEQELVVSVAGPAETQEGDNREDAQTVSKGGRISKNTTHTELRHSPGVPRPDSPTFAKKVEEMTLDDTEDWPEPDALPTEGPGIKPQLLEPDLAWKDSLATKADSDAVRAKGKKKKKSFPSPRKYDPGDPRIITLDSLGGTHSPTCSNLREYLVCEAKERLGVEITPGRLGMTAKGLPQQSNYCDCGIFVLGYVERFLKNPDMFVHDILQGGMSEKSDWADLEATKMRESIRDLIFLLHAKQVLREKGDRNARLKAKKESIMEPRSRSLASPAEKRLENGKSVSHVAMAPRQHTTGVRDSDDMPYTTHTFHVGGDENSTSLPTLRQKDMYSPASSDRESGPSRDDDLGTIETPRVKAPKDLFAEPHERKGNTLDNEIGETPATRQEPDMSAALAKSDAGSESPPNSPSFQKLAPNRNRNPSSRVTSEVISRTSSSEKAAKEPFRHNIFKEFARSPPSSPHRVLRRTAQKNGTSELNPFEIDDSQSVDRQEVRETPTRDVQRQDSFEDILASRGSPKSPHHKGRTLNGPISVDSSPVMRSSPRKSERKTASPELFRPENDSHRILRGKPGKHS